MGASVSIIIPSLKGDQALVELVRGLRAAADAPTEILVIDNGLAAGRVSELQASAEVISMGRNVGFGAAINQGAWAASGEILVILNDDIVPCDAFVSRLVEPCHAGADMVAGVLVQSERPDLIETAGLIVDAALGLHDYLNGEPVTRLEEDIPSPLGPCGGAAAYRRSVFVDAGGFDEGFFAYCEDADLALRLRREGVVCVSAKTARALHATSSTLGYRSLEKAKIVGYSRGYLLRKYGVLNHPLTGSVAALSELTASVLLGVEHRSFAPGLARVRGWRECTARAEMPPELGKTIGVVEGLRRRHARSRRFGSSVPRGK